MGCFDVFCALCGGPLAPGDLWDSLRSPDPEPGGMYWDYNQNLLCQEGLEWLRDLRFIGEWQSKADQDKHIPVTAEVYYASEFSACEGMFDATDRFGLTHWCYAYGKFENEGNYPGCHFVMHSACLLVAGRWMLEEGKTNQDLYNALSVYDAPAPFIGVFLPNQHYGAERFWGQDWIAKQRWEFVVEDPVNIPNMTEYILSKLQPVSKEEEDKLLEAELSTDDETYSCSCPGLDTEAHRMTCSEQMQSHSGLASPPCNQLGPLTFAAQTPQGQDFYRKQLLSGRLFALQDLDRGLIERRWDEIKDKDWRRLVQTLTRYENFYAGEEGSKILGELHDSPIGLKNRMRIIKILQGTFTGT